MLPRSWTNSMPSLNGNLINLNKNCRCFLSTFIYDFSWYAICFESFDVVRGSFKHFLFAEILTRFACFHKCTSFQHAISYGISFVYHAAATTGYFCGLNCISASDVMNFVCFIVSSVCLCPSSLSQFLKPSHDCRFSPRNPNFSAKYKVNNTLTRPDFVIYFPININIVLLLI